MKAIIFAAGRGERMRPLSDHCPKPLLSVGNKPLIVWHLERLVRAGITDIVINYAWLGQQFLQTLGDGHQWGAKLHYSSEVSALETAGGIAHALPLLGQGVFLAISGDIYTDFDFAHLLARAAVMQASADPKMHLVLVDNPIYHPDGDFGLEKNNVVSMQQPHFTYANIGLYDTRSFIHLDPQRPAKLAPLIHQAIAEGQVSGEHFAGIWHNIGTPEQLSALDNMLRLNIAADGQNLK